MLSAWKRVLQEIGCPQALGFDGENHDSASLHVFLSWPRYRGPGGDARLAQAKLGLELSPPQAERIAGCWL